jgi:sugar phosphate isomerase/epimerase
MMFRRLTVLLLWAISLPAAHGQTVQAAPAERDLFAQDNLIAWCIVPFDAEHRTPRERAAMLKQLGFTKFAYDWRDEHIPTFDEEIEALKAEGIELVAWWFPRTLDNNARTILDTLKRHNVKTQLWIALDDPAPESTEQSVKVAAAVAALWPIAEAAAAQGCSVGLYNHGGWFGEPENQLAIIAALQARNVGIVYNLHHAHSQFDRIEPLLRRMKPHLYAINLNGSDPAGDQAGRKILPLGQGELDLHLLQAIHRSGYRGPIGILGHTEDDAEARLRDNLDGLAWLRKQLEDEPPLPRPKLRTPVPPKQHQAAP